MPAVRFGPAGTGPHLEILLTNSPLAGIDIAGTLYYVNLTIVDCGGSYDTVYNTTEAIARGDFGPIDFILGAQVFLHKVDLRYSRTNIHYRSLGFRL
jgi:hypothetical protein